MKSPGIEYHEGRILVFEPWAIGIYGANLMLDGELLPAGLLLGPTGSNQLIELSDLPGALAGCAGMQAAYVLASSSTPKPESLTFTFVWPDGRRMENVRPIPDIVWLSDPNRSDPFRRIPFIELKQFTTKMPRH